MFITKDIDYLKLTKCELEVMQILWQASSPMTASSIADAAVASNPAKNKASIFTIQNLLKSLLKKGAIQVASYTRVSKTTAREYTAKITNDDYAVIQFNHYFSDKSNASTPNLVAALLERDENKSDTIEALEKLLADRKAQLVDKKKSENRKD